MSTRSSSRKTLVTRMASRSRPPGIAAQVEDQALDIVGQKVLEFVAQLLAGIDRKPMECDIGELVIVPIELTLDDRDVDRGAGYGKPPGDHPILRVGRSS